jgi:hypothetical protein
MKLLLEISCTGEVLLYISLLKERFRVFVNVYNKVLTGEGIYSVRAAGTGLFGLIRVLVGTDVFRVDQGVFK